ncbi:hypothetical protein [Neptunicoccus sediminis]|uniref:hypothetical protein n=1 Tax=Neptunicoccus sediminis TaxID=1892596 RepID=UPI000845BEA6|nr:hypothetical protein [Neptunicoccus sediminis]
MTLYRTIVFLLAAFYWLELFRHIDPAAFGWQFRFLTIWTLTANLIVAAQMLRLSLGRSTARWESFVSLVVVMNMAVLVQYWRLYFLDPANVTTGDGPVWWKEYYLHLGGAVLMWIDAFFLLGVFSRLRPVFVAVLVLGVAYPLWLELFVHPLNDAPVGTVTAGLPYPFLNDLELGGRLMFYAFVTAANIVFVFVGWGLARGVAAIRQR